MATLLLPSASSPDERLSRALVARLFRDRPVTEAGQVLAAIIVAVVLREHPAGLLIDGWAALVALVSLAGYRIRKSYEAGSGSEQVPARLLAVIGVMGLLWGGGGALLMHATGKELTHAFDETELVIIVGSAMVAASSSSLAASRVAFRLYLTALLLPIMVAFGVGDVEGSFMNGVLLVAMFAGAVFALHAKNHRSVRDGLALMIELDERNDDLRRKREEADRAREALRENERRWFQLIETMPAGVIVMTPDRRLYYANETARALRGPLRQGQEAGGIAYPVMMPGTDVELPLTELPGYKALSGVVSTIEYEVRSPRGARLVEATGTPIRGPGGEVVFGIAVLMDITARQSADRRRASAAAILEILASASTEHELDEKVTRAIGERFGADIVDLWRVEPAGDALHLSASWQHPGDDRLAKFAVERPLRLSAERSLSGTAWRQPWRVHRWGEGEMAASFHGKLFEATGLHRALAVPLVSEGRVYGVLTLFSQDRAECHESVVDILTAIGNHVGAAIDRRRADAALREADDRYRHLVEYSRDTIWEMDVDGRFTFLSAGARNIYHTTPADLLGRSFAERTDPAWLEDDIAMFQRLSRGEAIVDHESVHVDANGQLHHVSTSAAPLHDATGRIVGFHGTTRDIQEAVAIREALRAARDAAEQATAAKSAFLANVSHELRTPLNGVTGMAELLLGMELSPEPRRAAQLIVESSRSLVQVINEVLDYSRIEAGQPDFEEESPLQRTRGPERASDASREGWMTTSRSHSRLATCLPPSSALRRDGRLDGGEGTDD
jgi:PAS domain S-box-containing protein